MNISDLLVRHVEDELAAVPRGTGSVSDVMRRGRRRRASRKIAVSLVVVAAMLLFVMFPVPFDPNPVALAGSYEIPAAVEISDLEVAVEDQTPSLENPDVWIGYVHPAPKFDTSNLGPNLSFTPGAPSASDLGDRVLSAVYLGDLDGEPFYIYAVDPPTMIDRVTEIADGALSGEILGTTHGCCSGGDMDIPDGLPGMSTVRTGTEPPIVTAEWLGLTPNVSVVAYKIGNSFVGWQTPVGGVASVRLDHEPGVEVTLVAYAADGQEIKEFGPWPMVDIGNVPQD
jgi:hypothetical protein